MKYLQAVLSVDGKMYTWGSGDNGMLGHGNKISLQAPKMVEHFAGWFVVPLLFVWYFYFILVYMYVCLFIGLIVTSISCGVIMCKFSHCNRFFLMGEKTAFSGVSFSGDCMQER